MHVRGPIGRSPSIAETLSTEFKIAGILDAVLGPPLAKFQGGQAYKRLVGGTDWIGAGKGSIHQGVVWRLIEPLPVFNVYSVHKEVGVERRRGNEGQHFPSGRMDGNQRPAATLKFALRHLLQLYVQREPQVRPGHGVDTAERSHWTTRGGHLDFLDPCPTM